MNRRFSITTEPLPLSAAPDWALVAIDRRTTGIILTQWQAAPRRPVAERCVSPQLCNDDLEEG